MDGKKRKLHLAFLESPDDLPGALAGDEGGLPDGFIITRCGNNDDRSMILREIRKGDGASLLPVFLDEFLSDEEREASDGSARTREDMEAVAEDILKRLRDVEETSLRKSLDLRLLAFLYSREGKKLRPVLDPLSRGLYSYPLMDHLSGGMLESSGWITELLEKGYIREEALVDRIRSCPKCGGSHLNYVDVCPFCRSMEKPKIPGQTLMHKQV